MEIYKKNTPEFHEKIEQSKPYFLSGDFVANLKLWVILLMAFVGGIILNLMPCIFPVLSLKIISLAKMTEEQRSVEALFYAIGVVVSMLFIAGLLYVLRLFDNTLVLLQICFAQTSITLRYQVLRPLLLMIRYIRIFLEMFSA